MPKNFVTPTFSCQFSLKMTSQIAATNGVNDLANLLTVDSSTLNNPSVMDCSNSNSSACSTSNSNWTDPPTQGIQTMPAAISESIIISSSPTDESSKIFDASYFQDNVVLSVETPTSSDPHHVSLQEHDYLQRVNALKNSTFPNYQGKSF